MQALSPPVPIAARWHGARPAFVTFDKPLTPGPLHLANWRIYWQGLRYLMLTALVPDDPFKRTVQLTVGLTQATARPDSVTYAPPPFDVTSLKGTVPAPAFLGFPMTP